MNNIPPGFTDSLSWAKDLKLLIQMRRNGGAAELSTMTSWLALEDGGYFNSRTLRVGMQTKKPIQGALHF